MYVAHILTAKVDDLEYWLNLFGIHYILRLLGLE